MISDDNFDIMKVSVAAVGLVVSTILIGKLFKKERNLLKPIPKVGDQQVDTYCVLSWWRLRTLQIAILLALIECLFNIVEIAIKVVWQKDNCRACD